MKSRLKCCRLAGQSWLQRLRQGNWDDALRVKVPKRAGKSGIARRSLRWRGAARNLSLLLEAVRENSAELCAAGRSISEVFSGLALPTLIRAFLDAMEISVKPVTYMPILACLNETLTYQFGLADSNALALTLELAEPLLTAEVSAFRRICYYYEEFLDQLTYCWDKKIAAPAALRLLLDLLDAAYAFPVPGHIAEPTARCGGTSDWIMQ